MSSVPFNDPIPTQLSSLPSRLYLPLTICVFQVFKEISNSNGKPVILFPLFIVVSVNGKIRDKLSVSADITNEELEKLALASDKVKAFITGNVKKVIIVPKKIVNIVC